jgi:hypothetical protein
MAGAIAAATADAAATVTADAAAMLAADAAATVTVDAASIPGRVMAELEPPGLSAAEHAAMLAAPVAMRVPEADIAAAMQVAAAMWAEVAT